MNTHRSRPGISITTYVPPSNFDKFCERLLPGVHLDHLNTWHDLVHQSHPLVRAYCDFLSQSSDHFTKISCNRYFHIRVVGFVMIIVNTDRRITFIRAIRRLISVWTDIYFTTATVHSPAEKPRLEWGVLGSAIRCERERYIHPSKTFRATIHARKRLTSQ